MPHLSPIRYHRARTIVERMLITCSQQQQPNGGMDCYASRDATPVCRIEHRAPVYDARTITTPYAIDGELVACRTRTPNADSEVWVNTAGVIQTGDDPFESGKKSDIFTWSSYFTTMQYKAPAKPGDPTQTVSSFGSARMASRDLNISNVILILESNENSYGQPLPPGETSKTYEMFSGQTEILGPL